MDADRFKLEQELMELSHVEEDLDIVIDNVLEENLDIDEIANTLVGIRSLCKMRFERAFNTFENLIKNGKLTDSHFVDDYQTENE